MPSDRKSRTSKTGTHSEVICTPDESKAIKQLYRIATETLHSTLTPFYSASHAVRFHDNELREPGTMAKPTSSPHGISASLSFTSYPNSKQAITEDIAQETLLSVLDYLDQKAGKKLGTTKACRSVLRKKSNQNGSLTPEMLSVLPAFHPFAGEKGKIAGASIISTLGMVLGLSCIAFAGDRCEGLDEGIKARAAAFGEKYRHTDPIVKTIHWRIYLSRGNIANCFSPAQIRAPHLLAAQFAKILAPSCTTAVRIHFLERFVPGLFYNPATEFAQIAGASDDGTVKLEKVASEWVYFAPSPEETEAQKEQFELNVAASERSRLIGCKHADKQSMADHGFTKRANFSIASKLMPTWPLNRLRTPKGSDSDRSEISRNWHNIHKSFLCYITAFKEELSL